MTRTKVNIAAVADLVTYDHRITSSLITESLNIPKTVALQILKEDLGKRKLCANFLQHSLTPERKEDRVTTCQDIITMANADKIFFNKIITDETYCFAYDPETKRLSSEWVGDIPSAEETEIPMVPNQDNDDNFFPLSRHSAERIRTRGKNSKCRIL